MISDAADLRDNEDEIYPQQSFDVIVSFQGDTIIIIITRHRYVYLHMHSQQTPLKTKTPTSSASTGLAQYL